MAMSDWGASIVANADLRPMSIGEVLDGTFSLYKNHFWLFVGIMSWPFLTLLFFNVILGTMTATRGRALHGSTIPHAPTPALIGGAIGGAMVTLVLYLALVGAAQAATVFAVSDLYLGKSATIGSSFRRVRGNVGTVLGVMFLVGLVVGVGFILLIIPGIILLCRTAVSVPVAMLEDRGPGDSLSRSMVLTKGFAMQMFLIFLLAWVLGMVAVVVFQLPFTVFTSASKPHTLSFGLLLFQQLSGFLSQVLIGPIATIAFCLMYYNLRVRKEAFDLQHLMASLGAGSTEVRPAPGSISPA
jgi:hypothetical protein